MYGSTVNGLSVTGNSDLDLTIIYNDFSYDHSRVLRIFSQEI